MSEVLIPLEAAADWDVVRVAAMRVVRTLAPRARCHDDWPLGFDIGKSVAPITVRPEDVAVESNQDVGKVHSWMIGLERAVPVRNANGDPPVIGGGELEYDVTFALWGYFQTTLSLPDGRLAQDIAEREAAFVGVGLWMNHRLAMDPPQVEGVSKVFPVEFGDMDKHPFSDGVDVFVPQGSLTVRVNWTLR
jgi:hypothetical protein